MTRFHHVDELETPAVLIDLDVVEANIAHAQTICDRLKIKLRPHVKTHKMPEFAQMQVEAGAKGIACQKISEAEVFASAGFTDIQLPYNIVGLRKTAHLAELAGRCQISVTVDSISVVDGLISAMKTHGSKIAVLVELLTPQKRTGIDIEGALAIAHHIRQNTDCLTFAGISVYPCSVETSEMIRQCQAAFATAGIDIPLVSGGGSGAIHDPLATSELDELRIGSYIFYDWRSVVLGWAGFDDCAMRVRTTVVSANALTHVILDSGSKTLASENIDGQFGYLVEAPSARIYRLDEEHAYVDFSQSDVLPHVSDIFHIIPVHTCVVTNLHNQVFGIRGEKVEKVYDVRARGLVW